MTGTSIGVLSGLLMLENKFSSGLLAVNADIDKTNAKMAGLQTQTKGFDAEYGRLQAKLRGGSGFKDTAAGATGLRSALTGLVPAATIAGAGLLVKQFADGAGALVDFRASTGLTLTELQRLKFGAEQSGSSLEAVVKAVQKTQKQLVEGGKPVVAALNEIGVSLETLRKMSPGEQFETLTAAILKIEDPAKRTQLRMALLGKSGAELTANFKEMGDEAVRVGAVLDDSIIESGDDLGDNFDKLLTTGKALVGGFLGPFLPLLNGVASALVTVGGALTTYIIGPFFKALDPINNFNVAMGKAREQLERFGILSQTIPDVAGDAAAGVKKMWEEVKARGDLGIDTNKVLEDEEAIIKELTGSMEANNEARQKAEEWTRKQNEAADKLNAEQDKTLEKMKEAGIVTREVALKSLAPLIEQLNLAATASRKANDDGQLLRVALINLEPAVDEITASMRAAGTDTGFVTEMMKGLRAEAGSLPAVLQRVSDDGSKAIFTGFRDPIAETGLLLKGLPPLAQTNIGSVSDAFDTLRIQSTEDLQKIADEARRAYDRIATEFGAASPNAIAAHQRMVETVNAATRTIPIAWKDALVPTLVNIVKGVAQDVQTSFTGMTTGATAFGDGFRAVWQRMKTGVEQTSVAMFQNFSGKFLGPVVKGITGLFPATKAIFESMTASIGLAFGQMLTRAKGFKDGFISIWQSIKDGIARVLTSILNDFTDRFLKGLLGALSGQKGAFNNAFSGLLSGLMGLFGGGGAAAGAAPLILGTGGAGATIGVPAAAGGATAGASGGAGGFLGGAAGVAGGAAVGGLVGYGVGSATGNQLGASAAGAASGAAAGAALGAAFAPATLGLSIAVGALAGLIGGWVGANRANVRANNDRDQFIGQFGGQGTGEGSGFHNLQSQLTEATGVVQGAGSLFDQLIKANDPKEFAQRMQEVVKVLDDYKKKSDQATAADESRATAIAEVNDAFKAQTDAVRETIQGIDKDIAHWDATEAPEKNMGTIEKLARESLARQKADAEQKLDTLQKANEDAIQAVTDAGKVSSEETDQAFQAAFKGIEGYGQELADALKRIFDGLVLTPSVQPEAPRSVPGIAPPTPGPEPSPERYEGFATGTHGQFRDFGTEQTVRVHGREAIVPYDERASFANMYATDNPLSQQVGTTIIVVRVEKDEDPVEKVLRAAPGIEKNHRGSQVALRDALRLSHA